MEQLLDFLTKSEKDIINDIENLSGPITQEEKDTVTDRLRMNISAMFAEVRVRIYDGVRTEILAVENNNELIHAGDNIAVGVHAIVINPLTVRARGAYAVVWNENHQLNVANKNILSIMSHNSSNLLALLTLTNQMEVLNVKTVTIMTKDNQIRKTLERLPLWHNQNYKDEDGQELNNKDLLSQIYEIMNKNNIKFNIIENQNPMSREYELLTVIAKKNARNAYKS